jgi:hypothetical protein
MAEYVPYWQKLQDPRWQKKRLEIMERAGFACEACGDKESTLHVHHGYYEKDLEPCDYRDDTLWCLCECCHTFAEEGKRDLHFEIAKIVPKESGRLLHLIWEFRQKNSVENKP